MDYDSSYETYREAIEATGDAGTSEEPSTISQDQQMKTVAQENAVLRSELAESRQMEAYLQGALDSLRRAMESRQDGQDYGQKAVEFLPYPCYIYDLAKQECVWYNGPLRAMLGLAPEAVRLLGPAFLASIMHPDDLAILPGLSASFAAAPEGERPVVEYRLRTASGGWRWFAGQTVVLAAAAEGGPRQVMVILQDVTERRGLTQSLARSASQAVSNERRYLAEREQRELYQAALETARVGIIVLDGHDLSVRWANRVFARYLDESHRNVDLTGLPLCEVLPHAETSGLAEIARRVVATGRPCGRLDYRISSPGRATRDVRFALRPFKRYDGAGVDLIVQAEAIGSPARPQRPLAGRGLHSRRPERRLWSRPVSAPPHRSSPAGELEPNLGSWRYR